MNDTISKGKPQYRTVTILDAREVTAQVTALELKLFFAYSAYFML